MSTAFRRSAQRFPGQAARHPGVGNSIGQRQWIRLARYRALMESAPNGLWRVSKDEASANSSKASVSFSGVRFIFSSLLAAFALAMLDDRTGARGLDGGSVKDLWGPARTQRLGGRRTGAGVSRVRAPPTPRRDPKSTRKPAAKSRGGRTGEACSRCLRRRKAWKARRLPATAP